MFDTLDKRGFSLNRIGVAFVFVGTVLVASCTHIEKVPPTEIVVAGINVAVNSQ